MDKSTCRICLASRKRFHSLFENAVENINYAEIMATVANVNIFNGDGCPDTICYACGKKLKELYDFKLLIERSHATISTSGKKILFNNINDIKIEIDVKCKVEMTSDDPNNYTKLNFDGSDELVYKDTTIKKLSSTNNSVNETKKPMTISEFLNTFKEDDADDNNNDNDDPDYDIDIDLNHSEPDSNEDDEEYTPQNKTLKLNYVKKKKTKALKEKSNVIEIKPVFINDIRYIPAKPVKKKKKEPKENKYKIKTQMCPYCGKMTKGLKSHLLIHTAKRSVKCDYKNCSKRFYTQEDMNKHRTRHEAPKNYKCDHCPAAFYEKGSFKSHLLSHSDKKSYVCDICNKGFKRSGALSRHVKFHNIANKNVNCTMCTMSFFTNSGLRHHMRIHTGERPFKCEICSQPYSYKRDFTRHCYKRHGVFLKRRAVNIMNEEVLRKELEVMKEVVLRANGIVSAGEPLIPFEGEGPQATQAYQMAVQALQSNENIRF